MRGTSKLEKLQAGEQIAQDILAFIFSNWNDNSAFSVAAFISFSDEVNTEPLLNALGYANISVYIPICDGSSLVFVPHFKKHGQAAKQVLSKFDMVIVPGLAFDQNGARLGRGKGYYDRFLQSHPQSLVVGICADFQLKNRIPVEKHDVLMDFMCSPSRGLFKTPCENVIF